LLAARVAALRSQVMTVQLAQPLPRELPEPGIERQGLRSEVLLQVLSGVQQRLLDDVGRIDPASRLSKRTATIRISRSWNRTSSS